MGQAPRMDPVPFVFRDVTLNDRDDPANYADWISGSAWSIQPCDSEGCDECVARADCDLVDTIARSGRRVQGN